ncbi:MAG: hypothetical protein IJV64_04625, partial [Oscillospiraceae bacterium]|nr:hypothetical protein [Oscillospiraceae bacterium]
CDETGYGESDELYLGSYTLCQRDIPPYYASLLEDVSVSVEKKTRVEPPLNTLVCDRTKVLVTLSDELYATRPIEGATYVLRAEDGRSMPVAFTTNARGTFLLNELEKATVYRLSETASVGDYRLNRTDSAFTVSPDGRIDGETQLELTLTNRTLRVAIGVTDAFSSVQVPNVSLALYNLSDELIRTWTTAGTPLVFTELAEGRYYLIKDGDTEKRYEIAVRDLAEVQTINIHTRYALPYVVIGASAAAVILAVLLAARAVRKRRKTNRKATG